MKKIASFILALLLILPCLGSFGVLAQEEELLPQQSEWKYLVVEENKDDGYVSENPEGWPSAPSVSDWETGMAPFAGAAYAKPIANTVLPYSYFSAWMYCEFTVDDPSEISELIMSVIYDEDPQVYLNGELVWTENGYKDDSYVQVDISDSISLLNSGVNTLSVFFGNMMGGALFDMSLTACFGQPQIIDSEGKVIIKSVSTDGFTSFGSLNDPSNVLDMDQTSVTGSNFNPEKEQSLTAVFKGKVSISEIFVQCKDEGSTDNEDGTRGTYEIYSYCDGEQTDLGEIPAVTGSDGGYTLVLDDATEADSIKIVITSWQGDCWACIADIYVVAADEEIDITPSTPVITPDSTPTPTPEESSLPTTDTTPVDSFTTPQESETFPPEGETTPEEPDLTGDMPSDTNKTEQSDSQSGGNSSLIIVCVCLACLVIAGVAVAIIIKKKKNK